MSRRDLFFKSLNLKVKTLSVMELPVSGLLLLFLAETSAPQSVLNLITDCQIYIHDLIYDLL